jgi:tetratricopeptide (TPR) repeat protein
MGCGAAISSYPATSGHAGEGVSDMGEHRRSKYDVAFKRAASRASQQLAALLREQSEVEASLAELFREPPSRRAELVRTQERFHRLRLCELLEAQTRELWSEDPARVAELSDLTVQIAERLDPDRYGEKLVADARALAWAYRGNAHRIASDLRQAEEALRISLEYHRRAGEDAFTEAEILSFIASLRNSQGRFGEAARLLDRVIKIYRATKEQHLEGRAMIQKGLALGYGGQHRKAIRLIRSGLSRIDLPREPRLAVAAWHNLVVYLTESGRHQEALETLDRHRQLYLDHGDQMHLVRLRWLEGMITRDLGRLEEAEVALGIARDAFIELGIGFDAALVSLDLAMVYALREDNAAVKRLAAEMVPIFESRDVHQEAIAALLIFKEAAEAERVNLALLGRIAAWLQRSRRDPEARFELEN